MSRRKKRSPFSGCSAEELADLFLRGHDGDEAAHLLFASELSARLRARALTDPFAEEVFRHLPEEALHPFVWTCERLAAQEEVRIGSEPGVLQLFVVPVHGDLGEMEGAFRDGSLLTEVARSLRPTGYATAKSNVILKRDLIPATALCLVSPPRIRDLLMDAAAPLADQNGSGAVRRLCREAEEMSPNAEGAPGPELGATPFGVRFLIGVRASELDGLPDGLLPDPEEDETAEAAREEAWYDRMGALIGEEGGFVIEPPAPWGEARIELLSCAVRQGAELALIAEGVTDLAAGFREIRSRTVPHEGELEVRLLYRGRRLTELRLDFDLIGPDMDELLDLLELEYPPEEGGADPAPATVH